jgi:2-phosphosulfolactate phosphatase
LNAGRIVDFIKEAEADVTIICAGRQNRLSLEDTLCAGLMLSRLWDATEPEGATDAAHTAFSIYQTDSDDVGMALRRSNHAQNLAQRGYNDDIDYCFEVDTLPVLPYYKDNRLVLYEDLNPAPLANA